MGAGGLSPPEAPITLTTGLMDSFGCDLISVKIANFPTPVYFASLLTGFPLELGTGARK